MEADVCVCAQESGRVFYYLNNVNFFLYFFPSLKNTWKFIVKNHSTNAKILKKNWKYEK